MIYDSIIQVMIQFRITIFFPTTPGFFIKKKGVSNNNLETVIQGYRTPTNNEHHKAIT